MRVLHAGICAHEISSSVNVLYHMILFCSQQTLNLQLKLLLLKEYYLKTVDIFSESLSFK